MLQNMYFCCNLTHIFFIYWFGFLCFTLKYLGITFVLSDKMQFANWTVFIIYLLQRNDQHKIKTFSIYIGWRQNGRAQREFLIQVVNSKITKLFFHLWLLLFSNSATPKMFANPQEHLPLCERHWTVDKQSWESWV